MTAGVAILKQTISRLFFLGIAMGVSLSINCFARTNAVPCAANPENRQLDYWLGNWSIGAADSSGSAHSTVSSSLDRCLIIENWDGGMGHSGQNMFGYSAEDKNWYGMFADNEGRVHVFTSGKVSSGSAEFEGTSRGPKGETVLNRVKIMRLKPNQVEQTWEKSNDNGATWSVAFRGEYFRANH